MNGYRWSKEDEQFIIDNYKNMSNVELAKILERTRNVVQIKIRRLGILRTKEEIRKVRCKYSDEVIKFVKENMWRLTNIELGKKLGFTNKQIDALLTYYNIDRRKMRTPAFISASMAKYKIGELNPMWCGGHIRGVTGYCHGWSDTEYREWIYDRDGRKCLHPDCKYISDILVRHHINYIKKDCRPCNLITLCNSCNTRVNVDRKYWQEYFERINGNGLQQKI